MRARLANLARSERVAFDYLLNRYAVERLLRRAAATPFSLLDVGFECDTQPPIVQGRRQSLVSDRTRAAVTYGRARGFL